MSADSNKYFLKHRRGVVLKLVVTFGGMCCRRSIAVARVFALVMACRIILFVIKLSGYAKTVTPMRAGPHQAAQICRGGHKVFLVWKAVAYTDLLCAVIFNECKDFFID